MKVEIIKQLEDNYSYIIFSKESKSALILDPSEPKPLLDFLKKENLSLEGILITHHHSDHTSGIKEIKYKFDVKIYSPNPSIFGTSNLIKNKQKISFSFVDFEIISTPGHTLDHVVFFNHSKKLLFSGDTLFKYGCGRVFEGTNDQMLKSLNKLKSLPDETLVYCGHEYTIKNLEFINNELIDSSDKYQILESKKKILINGSSMPFYLHEQKKQNPYLNCDNEEYKLEIANCSKNKLKISPKASELEFFTFIREKRNNY